MNERKHHVTSVLINLRVGFCLILTNLLRIYNFQLKFDEIKDLLVYCINSSPAVCVII